MCSLFHKTRATRQVKLKTYSCSDPPQIDENVAAANLPVSECLALIYMLEVKSIIRDAGSRHYERA